MSKPVATRVPGFTLVELLVAVALIALLSALALPNLIMARQNANETVAAAYMRAWPSAMELYSREHGVYAPSDEALVEGDFLHARLGEDGSKSGYNFSIENVGPDAWYGRGWPVSPSKGQRYFYIDESGLVRYEVGAWADDASLPLGN